MSDFGKRGGTSKNAGKTAATYEATLPDGTKVTKRSYEIDTPEALLAVYQGAAPNATADNPETKWYANCICTAEWAAKHCYRTVTARRIR